MAYIKRVRQIVVVIASCVAVYFLVFVVWKELALAWTSQLGLEGYFMLGHYGIDNPDKESAVRLFFCPAIYIDSVLLHRSPPSHLPESLI